MTVPESVLIGGNHLANYLIQHLGGGFADQFPPETRQEDAMRLLGEHYDVWTCWAAIMRARDNR